MSIEDITTRLKKKLAIAPPVKAKVKLDFGDEGLIFIDATENPPVISHDDGGDADTTLVCTSALFEKIMNGQQDPTMAYMMGKLKIKGSMGLAMKLNSIFED